MAFLRCGWRKRLAIKLLKNVVDIVDLAAQHGIAAGQAWMFFKEDRSPVIPFVLQQDRLDLLERVDVDSALNCRDVACNVAAHAVDT